MSQTCHYDVNFLWVAGQMEEGLCQPWDWSTVDDNRCSIKHVVVDCAVIERHIYQSLTRGRIDLVFI